MLIGAMVGVAFAIFAAFLAASLLVMSGVIIQSGVVYGDVLLCFALVVGLLAFRYIRLNRQSPSAYNTSSASRYYLLGTVLGSGTALLTLGVMHLWVGLHR